jgi:TolB-like protein/tetratricopeptide (TPR) repeat protein
LCPCRTRVWSRNGSLRYLFEDYELDTERRELRRRTMLVPLPPQVFDMLVYLIENRERVVSKDDLIAAVWSGRIVSDSALTTRLNAARNAIGDSGEQQHFIKTLPRKGFRFIGQVSEEEQSQERADVRALSAPPTSALPLPDKPSIAVLPFAVMGSDIQQEYFADGMADEIITALSRCSSLFVIARNSSFTYKGRTVDVRQIGRELGVRYVLEGSVRRAGKRLRINAQLVDASTGMHIWADRFDGDASDVFDLQDRISEGVVGAIEPKVQLAEIARLRHKLTLDLGAYDLLLRAQALEYEFTEQSLEEALHCLDQALTIDPSYAPALALAAYCRAERQIQGWTRAQEKDASEGVRLAVRSLELGKDDPNVLWMAAFAVRHLGADPHRARELANRSLQLNPNSAMALTTAGLTEAFLANPVRALELLGRAERLSPRDPKAWYIDAVTAMAHFVGGQFEQAAMRAKKASAQNAHFTFSLRILAASLVKLGRFDDATRVMREMLTLEPDLTVTKLRSRGRYLDEAVLHSLTEALRAAGLPE